MLWTKKQKLTDAQIRILKWIDRGKAFATRSSELHKWRYWYDESELPGYSYQVAIRQETMQKLQKQGYVWERCIKGNSWKLDIGLTDLGKEYLQNIKGE